jgi:26S proteasome non-ATPase regulatory subunit 9
MSGPQQQQTKTAAAASETEEALAAAELERLHGRRAALEAELSAALAALGPVGMDTPLVDAEGFPRADIDVWTVRHQRQAVIRLRNDLKALLPALDGAVARLFALRRAAAAAAVTADGEPRANAAAVAAGVSREAPVAAAEEPALALLNAVSPDSPAAAAGLAAGDELLALGGVTARTPGAFPGELTRLVGGSVGRPLAVRVRRPGCPEVLSLSLVPQTWGGRGLLGCHLLPAVASAAAPVSQGR